MPRGRPIRSEIRQGMVEILAVKGSAYGYELAKIYNAIFPQCTRENVYYHLRKGTAIGEFVVKEIKEERGEYSWGSVVEKKYYRLGPKAVPRNDPKVKDFFDKLKPRKS